MTGALAWQVAEVLNKNYKFLVFEERSHGNCPGSLLPVLCPSSLLLQQLLFSHSQDARLKVNLENCKEFIRIISHLMIFKDKPREERTFEMARIGDNSYKLALSSSMDEVSATFNLGDLYLKSMVCMWI
ncbi:uncharacterized protein LOC123226373 [Mangifera indica]|uniref:uncharacterized protein LOC123226373 n=1 Tax=Mangifera indica TaxID=29780 RepID=UPI001CF9F554|nr:uncharacterized protein LOC123226373 [Mangifera indica]